jgi:hypothetical protein
VVLPRAERIFGRLAVSYVVEPRRAGRCRLVACLSVAAPSSFLGSARLTLLSFGDLLMMRKQLITLKEHAERRGSEPRGRSTRFPRCPAVGCVVAVRATAWQAGAPYAEKGR